MITSPKSVIALLLFASISIVACKKDKAVHPRGDALFVSIDGFMIPPSPEYPYKKIQITATGSYEISFTGENKSDIRQLPGNIHDSLKPYLSSFPQTTIKADPAVNTYGAGIGRDMPVRVFTYIQENPADTTRIQIDFNTYVPYMEDFQKKIEQTIKNCKLLGY
jgi:hypothetical protein